MSSSILGRKNEKIHNNNISDSKIDSMLLQLRGIITDNNNYQNNNKKSTLLESFDAYDRNDNYGDKIQSPSRTLAKQYNSRQNAEDNLQQKRLLDIDTMIEESSRLLETRKQFIETKPFIKGRILAAAQLLKNQQDMVKSYVKDKIQSQLFNNQQSQNHLFEETKRQKALQKDKLMEQLQYQRRLLLQRKQEEERRQSLHRQQIVSQVREFQTDSRVTVDVREINSLLYKQEPQLTEYLMNNQGKLNNSGGEVVGTTVLKEVKSRSNEVRISSLCMSEVYEYQLKENQSMSKVTLINNQNNMSRTIVESKMSLNTNKQRQRLTKQLEHERKNNIYSHEDIDERNRQEQYIEFHDDVETFRDSPEGKRQNIQNYKNQQNDNRDKSKKEEDDLINYSSVGRLLKNKHNKFVSIFYEFIKNQLSIMNLQGKNITLGSAIDQLDGSSGVNNKMHYQPNGSKLFVWKQQKIKPPTKKSSNNKNSQQTITSITNKFKFKPFSINEQTKVQYERQKISQRRVNKMIGQSSKFHAKKCILTKNQLIYYEQKQSKNQGKHTKGPVDANYAPQTTTKHIELEIQRIQPDVFKKQQGSFFSKKQINTELVTVKGKARTFKFEHDFLQGRQLAADLKTLMAAKVYALISKLNGSNNLALFQFIYGKKMKIFDMSEFLIPNQAYTIKQERQKHLTILFDTLTDDPTKATTISLKNIKLQPNEFTLIFKNGKKLQKLTKIDLSNNRLNKQIFMELCQFINQVKCTHNDGIEVLLRNCKLDDDCLLSNVGVFTSACTKIGKLDLAYNGLTAKSIQVIKSCLESATCKIKHLDLSHCPIKELQKLNALIKQSRKLQSLEAENCRLQFDDKRFEQLQKFFDFLKSSGNSQNLRRVNLCKNGALTEKEFRMIESQWYFRQENNLQLVIDLDLAIIEDTKNNNLLGLSDHNINGKQSRNTILGMKLYNNQ